jgi:hypothetical protein
MEKKCCEYNPRMEGLKQTLTIRGCIYNICFSSYHKNGPKKAKVFVSGKPLQSSIM